MKHNHDKGNLNSMSVLCSLEFCLKCQDNVRKKLHYFLSKVPTIVNVYVDRTHVNMYTD